MRALCVSSVCAGVSGSILHTPLHSSPYSSTLLSSSPSLPPCPSLSPHPLVCRPTADSCLSSAGNWTATTSAALKMEPSEPCAIWRYCESHFLFSLPHPLTSLFLPVALCVCVCLVLYIGVYFALTVLKGQSVLRVKVQRTCGGEAAAVSPHPICCHCLCVRVCVLA